MSTTIDDAFDVLRAEAFSKLPSIEANMFVAELKVLVTKLHPKTKWVRHLVSMNEASLQLDHGCALVTMTHDPTLNQKVAQWRATTKDNFYSTGIAKTVQAACDDAEHWLEAHKNG